MTGSHHDAEEEPRETAAPSPDSPVDDGSPSGAGAPDDRPEVDNHSEAHSESVVEADPLQAARDEVEVLKMELAERTVDLQRLQAEFLNYKRRVDRDRELIRENATYTALAPITEVLDTIDRARDHAPLEDGFKAVADQLERIVSAVGLTKFGEVGDAFDPTVHEALSHIGEDPDVSVTTCKVIAKAGYRIGDRVVRAAQVLVVDPVDGEAGPAEPADAGGTGEQGSDQPTE